MATVRPVPLNDRPDVVATLVRSYSPAVTGVPKSGGFDQETWTSTLTYRPWRDASRQTVLFLPERVDPVGYAIEVDGGHGTRRAGEYVWIRHHPGPTSITVSGTPSG